MNVELYHFVSCSKFFLRSHPIPTLQQLVPSYILQIIWQLGLGMFIFKMLLVSLRIWHLGLQIKNFYQSVSMSLWKATDIKDSDLAYGTHVHERFLSCLFLIIGTVSLLFLYFRAFFRRLSLRLYLLLSTSHSRNKKSPQISRNVTMVITVQPYFSLEFVNITRN